MRPVFLCVLLAAAASAAAQDATTPGAAGAEAAVEAYATAFAAGEMELAASLMDPVELADFVDLMGFLAAADSSDDFSFAEDETPVQAFASFLDQVMGVEPLVGEALRSLKMEVLGSVPEGEGVRHVVVRSQFAMMDTEMAGLEVTTARWTGERWVIAFDAQMQGFRQMLEAAVQEAEADGSEE